jgi:hypothetical protein
VGRPLLSRFDSPMGTGFKDAYTCPDGFLGLPNRATPMLNEQIAHEADKADSDRKCRSVTSDREFGAGCPEPEIIVGFALGDEVLKENEVLWQHILTCEHCRGEIRALGLAADEICRETRDRLKL